MTSNRPPSRHRDPAGTIQGILVPVFILIPTLLGLHMEQRSRYSVIDEFREARGHILSRIETAVEHTDLDTLHDLDKKYASTVPDNDFRSRLHEAVARVTAKETQMELAASRHLDLERHTREVSIRPDPMRPQLPREDKTTQRLSVLPR